jgi:hypothetical protein
MCTVTVVRNGGETIITSNRDEQVSRPAALSPKKYLINGKSITFPKDPFGGGTWFAIDDFGNAVVLLNGAKEKHQVLPQYRKSRGLILLDIISSTSPIAIWPLIDLSNIEAFTIVLFENKKLYELQWDGFTKQSRLIDRSSAIWSSSTLYSKLITTSRESWFDELLSVKGSAITALDMIGFHTTSHNDDHQNGLIIDRQNLKTLSVTQAKIQNASSELTYFDLKKTELAPLAEIS